MSTGVFANLDSAHHDEVLIQNAEGHPPQFEVKVREIVDYLIVHAYMLASITATDKFMEYFSGHKSILETTPTTEKSMKYFSGTATARYYFYDDTQTQIQAKTQEIRDWYTERVSQILEAENILYKQEKQSIAFVVVVDHICRDHSFQLSDTACELDDLYPDWEFGFQYVSVRTAGQLPLDDYSDLINDG